MVRHRTIPKHKIEKHHDLFCPWKPVGWSLSRYSPIADWGFVLRPDWGRGMKRNAYARALSALFFHTQAVGLGGRLPNPVARRRTA